MLELQSVLKSDLGEPVEVNSFSFLENPAKVTRLTGIHAVNMLDREGLYRAFSGLVHRKASELKVCSLFIVVTQTKPFELPQLSNALLEEIGTESNVECIDLALGCTGYVYATSLAERLLEVGQTCAILTGDAISSVIGAEDVTNRPLFGDAAFLSIHRKMDGQFKATTENLFKGSHHLFYNNHNASVLPSNGFYMNGLEVFNFGLHVVSRFISDWYAKHPEASKKIVLHQANKFMLVSVMKKLKALDLEAFYNDGMTGNSGSSTIPDVMASNAKSLQGGNLVVVGFGVGLQMSINELSISMGRVE